MTDLNSTIDSLKKALGETPKNVPLRLHLAQVYDENDMLKEANDEYVKILSLESDRIEAIFHLGINLFKLKDYKTAKKHLMKIKNPQSSIYLAKIFLEEKDREKAKEYYQGAVKQNENLKDEEFESELFGERVRVSQGPNQNEYEFENIKSDISFKDIGGLEKLKAEIKLKIISPYEKDKIFKAYGKKAGGGILLYGPPGCGKTMLAKATAGEIDAKFMSLEISDILDMWRGESEKKLHAFFETARKRSPTVIFIDEIDAIGADRDKFNSSEMKSLVNQFLSEMDGLGKDNSHILIVGATNTPWNMDSALRRPGRFDKMIFVSPPDNDARVEILKIHTKDKPKEDLDYKKLAKLTKGFSGADINRVIEQALEDIIPKAIEQNKVIPITTNNLVDASKSVRCSVKEWFHTAQNYIDYGNQAGLYDDVKEYIEREGF